MQPIKLNSFRYSFPAAKTVQVECNGDRLVFQVVEKRKIHGEYDYIAELHLNGLGIGYFTQRCDCTFAANESVSRLEQFCKQVEMTMDDDAVIAGILGDYGILDADQAWDAELFGEHLFYLATKYRYRAAWEKHLGQSTPATADLQQPANKIIEILFQQDEPQLAVA